MSKRLALFFSYRISLKDWYDLGLLEREVKLYNGLSSYFEKIFFFTYGGNEDKKFGAYLSSNIEVIPIPLIRNGGRKKILIPLMLIYSIFMPFIHWENLKGADILKTNQVPGSWTALITKLLFRKKLILRCGYIWSYFALQNKENAIKRYVKKFLEKITCAFADSVICSSVSDRKYLEDNHGVKAEIIPNYVDTELFKPMEIPKVKNSICFVGRLEKQKNLIALVDALKDLPYNLTIIGSGNMKKELENKVNENKFNVKFMNNVPHSKLPIILNRHEIFILPSLYEGTPKVLLEAMACGLPVIGTDVKGINEVIEHEKNGILCGESSEAIRRAIVGLMEEGSMRERLGKAAAKSIREEYALNKLIEREKEVYGLFV